MIGVTFVMCVIMTLRAVHGNSTTTPTPSTTTPSTTTPPTTPTPSPTTTTLTPTGISTSNSVSPTTITGTKSINATTTSPASDSSSTAPVTLAPSTNTIAAAATTSSTTNPTITKSGLNQQEEIAIISFAMLAIAAIIVAFVAVLSVRINRAREKPRSSQIEMREMNGNPTIPKGYSSSEYSSRISVGNTSGSHGNVSFSVEPLVNN